MRDVNSGRRSRLAALVLILLPLVAWPGESGGLSGARVGRSVELCARVSKPACARNDTPCARGTQAMNRVLTQSMDQSNNMTGPTALAFHPTLPPWGRGRGPSAAASPVVSSGGHGAPRAEIRVHGRSSSTGGGASGDGNGAAGIHEQQQRQQRQQRQRRRLLLLRLFGSAGMGGAGPDAATPRPRPGSRLASIAAGAVFSAASSSVSSSLQRAEKEEDVDVDELLRQRPIGDLFAVPDDGIEELLRGKSRPWGFWGRLTTITHS